MVSHYSRNCKKMTMNIWHFVIRENTKLTQSLVLFSECLYPNCPLIKIVTNCGARNEEGRWEKPRINPIKVLFRPILIEAQYRLFRDQKKILKGNSTFLFQYIASKYLNDVIPSKDDIRFAILCLSNIPFKT